MKGRLPHYLLCAGRGMLGGKPQESFRAGKPRAKILGQKPKVGRIKNARRQSLVTAHSFRQTPKGVKLNWTFTGLPVGEPLHSHPHKERKGSRSFRFPKKIRGKVPTSIHERLGHDQQIGAPAGDIPDFHRDRWA